jgi:hypothetical protein
MWVRACVRCNTKVFRTKGHMLTWLALAHAALLVQARTQPAFALCCCAHA